MGDIFLQCFFHADRTVFGIDFFGLYKDCNIEAFFSLSAKLKPNAANNISLEGGLKSLKIGFFVGVDSRNTDSIKSGL